MSTRGRAVSELAEAACLQVILRMHDYEYLVSNESFVADISLFGRHRSSFDVISYRRTHALVGMVAIAEDFTIARYLSDHPKVDHKSLSSWTDRRKLWKKYCGLDIDQWDIILGFVEVRNAIQHGLGRLTDRQLSPKSRSETLKFLAAAEIERIGDRLVVDDDTVRRCGEVCISFMMALDCAAPKN